MCPPTYFELDPSNPWTPPHATLDRDRAKREWETLRAAYEDAGHRVSLLEPRPELTQMVFSGNGAFLVGDQVMLARFHSPDREGEVAVHRAWFESHGYDRVFTPDVTNEGEGDFFLTERFILAGTGFRTEHEAHLVAQDHFGVPVISLRLVDERFYHLDTALFVLDNRTIAYYPPAFSEGSRRVLERLFPDALIADEQDAFALGLNCVSDGTHVFVQHEAENLRRELAGRGYRPVPIDMTEFRKAGGAPKCCTMRLYR
ncbi:amidinotransferase [Nonomuraea sp. NN258]|nr:amidinotransferase [Nonomuraea antri]